MIKYEENYPTILANMHFYPCRKNTKMDVNYENAGYTTEFEYTDFIAKNYFFDYTESGNINLPKFYDKKWVIDDEATNKGHWELNKEKPLNEIRPQNFINLSRSNNEIDVTLDYPLWELNYQEYLKKQTNNFNLLKTNYFISDFNALNSKIKWSFWFVTNTTLTYDEYNLQPATITFHLKLDEYSTFYNIIWTYSGVVNILRMHNQRWVKDFIFNSEGLIPDFQSNQFIRNCDGVCSRWTEKIQQTQTQPLISSRHWNLKNEVPINNGRFLQWDKLTYDGKVKSKKVLILLWLIRVDQVSTFAEEDKAKFTYWMGDITNLNGYSIPMRLVAYVSSGENDVLVDQKEFNDLINKIQVDGIRFKGVEQEKDKTFTYRVVNATISEDLWISDTFIPLLDSNADLVPNAYECKDGILNYYSGFKEKDGGKGQKEYFYFLDKIQKKDDREYGVLWNKIFKTPAEITGKKFFDKENYSNLDIEPHLFTNNHFSTTIQLFNKNGITFDISTLLINSATNFDHIEAVKGDYYYTFQIMERKGTISPDMYDIKYFLLDKDTSVAYKRDNNVMTLGIQGAYTWPFYDNTYNEWLRNNQHQRQAGYDNIQTQYKTGQDVMWLQNTKGWLGGAITGAVGGASVGGLAGGLIGAFGGLVGAGMSSAFDMPAKQMQLDAQKEMAVRSMDAQYEDSKNMKGNINGGSPLTTQADICFSYNIDDDNDERNYKSIWTPSITTMQVKNYDAYTIVIYLNKNGYPQNRWQAINSLNDLMIRKYWNILQIANADEFFKKDAIQPEFVYNLLSAFISKGIRFWNLELLPYDDLFNYEINNYEKNLDKDILILQKSIDKET